MLKMRSNNQCGKPNLRREIAQTHLETIATKGEIVIFSCIKRYTSRTSCVPKYFTVFTWFAASLFPPKKGSSIFSHLLCSVFFANMALAMSNYNLTPIVSPSIEAFDAKAARKKVLDEVRKRRYQIAQTRHNHEQQTYQ